MANLIIKNTFANVVAKIWAFLSLYIFVPIWIHFLGVEGYGVISFYTVLMSLMLFADAGLTATLTREFARGDVNNQYRRDLLRTIELIYFCIALILFLVLYVFSDIIAAKFLKSSLYTHEELKFCVQIMALTVSFQFLFSMYCGGLLGLQKQVLANTIVVLHSITRSAVVIIPLLISNSIQTFFIWQLFSILIALIIVRYSLVRCISEKINNYRFRPDYLKNVWKFAVGMMLMSFISSLNTQLDKLVTGNVLSLEDLGYYSLASTVGIVVISIVQPLGVAIYPELTRLLSCNKKRMNHLLYFFTFVVSVLSVGIGLTIFFYVDEFIFLWTHDMKIVQAIRIPTRLLILGNILQAFQFPPYYLALANGHTKTNVKLGLIMLIFLIPAVYFFTIKWGLNATAIPYVIINLCGTIYLSFSIINRFHKGLFGRWFKYASLPLLVEAPILFVVYFLLENVFFVNSVLIVFCIGVLTCLLSFYACASIFIRYNNEMINFFPNSVRKYII